MHPRTALVFLVLASAACKGADSAPAGDSATLATTTAAANEPTVKSFDGTFSVTLPRHWSGAYRVDTLSTVERGGARPGALNVVYLPSDSSVIPQTLVVIAVYDSAAWKKATSEGGPPPGDSSFAKDGRVYVLGLPQSNPFTPGSVDAFKFDSLALTAEEKARLIKVP